MNNLVCLAERKKQNISLVIIFFILIFLIVIGSFLDLKISDSLYLGETFGSNFFGILFSYIGIIPTFLGWTFLGSSILALTRKQEIESKKRKWLTVLSVFLVVLSFFFFCNTLFMVNASSFPVHWLLAYLIGIICIVITFIGGYKMAQKSSNNDLLKYILFITAISIITMIIVMTIKEITGRPRYRFVMEENIEYFKNWWQSGKYIEKEIMVNINTDEFSSFPSGHSAYSMFAIFVFPLISEYSDKLKKYKSLLFYMGLIWWLLTAFSRITVGAHYLTDVSVGGIIVILSYYVVWLLRNYINKKTKKVK